MRSWRRRRRICTATPSSGRWRVWPKSAGREIDTFWTWRETMYRFALHDVAGRRRGGRRAALCRDAGGGVRRGRRIPLPPSRARRFALCSRVRKWPGRIVAAARRAGIGLTLLPVFYAHSTFGGAPPRTGAEAVHQRRRRRSRVSSTIAAAMIKGGRDEAIGIAPHSLRAVTPSELSELIVPRRRRARSTSTPPSRSRRSRTASPGRAPGRCAGCSTMRASTKDGASCMRPTWMSERRETSRARARSPAFVR